MTKEAADIYFDLLEKTSTIWEGSAEEFDKVASGRIRTLLGGVAERLGGRMSGVGKRLTTSGERAAGELVTHPRTGEQVFFNRLSKMDKNEVLRAQRAQYADDLVKARAEAQAKAKAQFEAQAKAQSKTQGKGIQEAGEAVTSPGTSAPESMLNLRNILMGTGLAGATGAGAYYMGRSAGEEGAINNRNLAFGGGLAAGLAAPHILTGVNQIVANQGLIPTGPYAPSNFQRI